MWTLPYKLYAELMQWALYMYISHYSEDSGGLFFIWTVLLPMKCFQFCGTVPVTIFYVSGSEIS